MRSKVTNALLWVLAAAVVALAAMEALAQRPGAALCTVLFAALCAACVRRAAWADAVATLGFAYCAWIAGGYEVRVEWLSTNDYAYRVAPASALLARRVYGPNAELLRQAGGERLGSDTSRHLSGRIRASGMRVSRPFPRLLPRPRGGPRTDTQPARNRGRLRNDAAEGVGGRHASADEGPSVRGRGDDAGLDTREVLDMRRVAGLLLFCAVAVAPFACKVPVGPAKLALSDCCVAVGGCLLACQRVRGPAARRRYASLSAVGPFLVAALLSAIAAPNPTKATVECVKLVLYFGIGVLAASELMSRDSAIDHVRRAVRCAVLLTALGCASRGYLSAAAFTHMWGTPRSLAWGGLLFLPILAGLQKTSSEHWTGLDRAVVLLGILCVPLMLFPSPGGGPVPAAEGAKEPIPQQMREGYAALSVMARAPLFGLGPGNYQEHIGEYYQGMPKENAMANGSQIGYGVMLASMGVMGLAGYLYWLRALFANARAIRENRMAWLGVVAILAVSGVFTPLLVSQLLMPMVLAHAWLARERSSPCA